MRFVDSPVGSHVAYKQLCCLLHSNEPARGVKVCGGLVDKLAGNASDVQRQVGDLVVTDVCTEP